MAVSRAQTRKSKISEVLSEHKRGTLRSSSKKGPKVTSQKQAVAIALSEGRKAAKRRA